MATQTLHDYGRTDEPGYIALAVTGASYSDENILRIAERLPEGQYLWAFSPTYRNIDNDKLRVTHVNVDTTRQFQLYVAHHLGKFIQALPEGTPITPRRQPFPTETQEFDSDEQYVPTFDQRLVVTKYIDGVPFEFFSDIRTSSKKLVVFGQSALTRDQVSLPYFFRWKWSHRIDASVVIWNDPALYLDDTLEAAWWVGTPERDYVSEGVGILQTIIDSLGIEPEDVLFFGSSAGGFSAFQMGTMLPGSKIISENPYLTLRVAGEIGKVADQAISSCLGYDDVADVPAELAGRIDVLDRMRQQDYFPPFYLLQNVLDERHMTTQYGPFKDEFQALPQFISDEHCFVEYEQWSLLRGGHFPLKESAMLRIIQSVLDGTEDLPPVLSKEQITLD